MNKHQLRELISETLKEFGHYSVDAVELLMLTAAVETNLGKYLKQVKGPALGIFQMEPSSFKDNLKWFLKKEMGEKINNITSTCNIEDFRVEALVYNLKFAIVMSRIHFLRKPGILPSNTVGWAEYWKKHYNTHLGRGTVGKAIEKYNKYCK